MAEISREEGFNLLRRLRRDMEFIIIPQYLKDKYVNGINKGISDMEKVAKIENIIDDIFDFDNEDCEFDLRLIKKIVKGE